MYFYIYVYICLYITGCLLSYSFPMGALLLPPKSTLHPAEDKRQLGHLSPTRFEDSSVLCGLTLPPFWLWVALLFVEYCSRHFQGCVVDYDDVDKLTRRLLFAPLEKPLARACLGIGVAITRGLLGRRRGTLQVNPSTPNPPLCSHSHGESIACTMYHAMYPVPPPPPPYFRQGQA